MQTFDSIFQRELRKFAAERIESLRDSLSINNFTTVAEFRYVMGQIAALRDLDSLIEDAKGASEQRNR